MHDEALEAAYAESSFCHPLRTYQRRALDTVAARWAAGDRRMYIVMPPGSGKTVVGLELIRRAARRALVLVPNTAVQAQWLSQWQDFRPVRVPAAADRRLAAPVSVLTYQALCTFDTDGDPDRRPVIRDGTDEELLGLLHPNGRAVVERAAASGPLTLVLDECHHLLETWGALVRALIGRLGPDLVVVGLTATPPTEMTAREAALHDDLFGTADFIVPTPAVVKEGELAPYQELVYLTTPTTAEDTYIASERARFGALQVELADAQLGTVPLFAWLDRRLLDRRTADGALVGWSAVERAAPALARAALRFASVGLLAVPEGARLREEHRRPPEAADWVAVLEDYCLHHLDRSSDPHDRAAREDIARVLPALGYRLTATGVRAATSPVNRLLALSESKAAAALHVLEVERQAVGDRLRALVLCDFERAESTLPTSLAGAVQPDAGSARHVASLLAGSPATASLLPVLVTGRTVACGAAYADEVVAALSARAPDLGPLTLEPLGALVSVTSAEPGWRPMRWTPLVTALLESGVTRCLVGTRALLGEGWDARSVNVVVDLTAATTGTSVHQIRGRSLRLDPTDPTKVADNWSVVCVADHPEGGADYARFVRKHHAYLALNEFGDVESGVSHVDHALSPYGPPDDLAGVTVRMLDRPAQRSFVRQQWRIGEPYADTHVAVVRIRTRRTLGLPTRPVVSPTGPAKASRPHPAAMGVAVALGGVVLGLGGLAAGEVIAAVAGAVATGAAGAAAVVGQARAIRRALPSDTFEQLAWAVADGLLGCAETTAGADRVRVAVQSDGYYRALLEGVTEAESRLFAESLDELLGPLASPRYLIGRLVVQPPTTGRAAAGLALRRLLHLPVTAAVAYHSVPSYLAVNAGRVEVFAAAWRRHVAPTTPVYAGSPEGGAILDLHRGADPFAVTSQIRTLWW